MSSPFPDITISGDPEQRGLAYGEQLKDRIHDTFNFYFDAIFLNSALTGDEIRRRADRVRGLVEDYAPAYVLELDAMARAADMESWKIYMLNARTEVLNAPVAECTSMYFKDTGLLGQTWDWIMELEDLVVILRYELENDHVITTLAEPGMLAKIGMNNAGLGVCLNFLVSHNELDGVPVHIVLRSLLDCRNLDQAHQRILESGQGKSSHFLVANESGEAFGMEFANGSCAETTPDRDMYIHSNHCIATGMESTMVPTSLERLEKAQQLATSLEHHGVREMQDILLDDSMGNNSIQAPYHPEEALGGLKVGSCATVVMELGKRVFHYRKGPGKLDNWGKVSCDISS